MGNLKTASKAADPGGEARKGKGIFRVGPGLVIAIVLSALIYFVQRQSLAPRRPIIQRTVASAGAESLVLAPTIGFILQESAALELSKQQVRKLESLRKEWEAATLSERKALETAEAEFDKWRAANQKRGGVSLQEVQSHTAALSQLSGALAAERRLYWERAQAVLTQRQVKKAEEMARINLQATATSLRPSGPARAGSP